MNTKKTKVKFYVEEPCCDCGGKLKCIDYNPKSMWKSATTFIYKCADCGKEYNESNYNGLEPKLCFEYNGKKYIQRMELGKDN